MMPPRACPSRRLLRAMLLAAPLLAAPLPAAAQQPPQRATAFTVQNETDITLREFYLAPPNAAARGPDRLGADVVAPGASHRIRLGDAPGCVFDALAVFVDGSEDRRPGLDICRTPLLVLGDPTLPALVVTLANRGTLAVRELYAVRSGSAPERGTTGWGPDRLGTAMIGAGASFTLRLRSRDCVFDLRAVYADDTEELRDRTDLCTGRSLVFARGAAAGAAPPGAEARRLVLANRHLARVQQVYLSASTDSDWGPDRLGDATLAVDQDTTVEMQGGCAADLRIVFPNGAAEERRAVDVCATTRIVLRPGWVVAERLDEEGPVPGPTIAAGAAALRLRNGGPLPIVELYADAPGAPRGEDRLGEDTLPIGAGIEIEPTDPDACLADLVAVFRDGREVTQRGVDLCAGEELELR